MKKIAVLLSGCGYLDGAEIRESVLTLLALDSHPRRSSFEVIIMAPNLPQYHVVNHLSGEVTHEKRNVLQESARIARGKIQNLSDINPALLDGLLMPGGFGVAKNLSNFAFEGVSGEVDATVKDLISRLHSQKKPIGAICIAPAVISMVLGNQHIKVTIGHDKKTALGIEETGAVHCPSNVDDVCIDTDNKIVTTPAYMDDAASLDKIYAGIQKCVFQVLDWT